MNSILATVVCSLELNEKVDLFPNCFVMKIHHIIRIIVLMQYVGVERPNEKNYIFLRSDDLGNRSNE